MKKFSISVLGQDRPGIIAAVTKILMECDFNLEDVSQTILQSEFSSIFIVSGPENRDPEEIRSALVDGTRHMNMHFHVRELESNPTPESPSSSEPFVITTFGPDRKGLVAEITRIFADFNVNVTRLQAVFRGGDTPDRNIMIYEVDVTKEVDQQMLRKALMEKCQELKLVVTIQHKKIFEAVNRI